MTGIHGTQAILLLLLTLVVIFAATARRLSVPYPIVLVIAGLLISFVPHMPRIPLKPDLVFLIFLPPLLFAAAWQTSLREFRNNLFSILMLAFGLVAFTVWGVAFVGEHIFYLLDWKSGFLLGAVVSTTDAIAATSIGKSIGLPGRVMDVLEGESLVNDASGLLALEFGVLIVINGQTPTFSAGLLRLVWLAGAGVLIGLLIGFVVAWCERWIDDGDIEIVISLVVPYTAYLAAEGVHASGVLAVVACGLYMSRKSVTYFSPEVRIQVTSVWRALNFALNGLVFVLIGLQLPYVLTSIGGYSRKTLILDGAAFSGMLILLRVLWVFPAAYFIHFVRTRFLKQQRPRPPAKQIFVVGWTGMRGVIALAAALSLPETLANGQPFVQRNLILYLTFCVILVTLVVQGLSLPPLIRALGLAREGDGVDTEETEARRQMLCAAVNHLEEGQRHAEDGLQHGFEDLLHTYRHRLAVVQRGEEPKDGQPQLGRAAYLRLKAVSNEALEVERATLIRLRDEGAIGDELQRKLERELDLTETRQKA